MTKIVEDGYAVRERHFSVHSHPNTHTNPHDHIIDWSKNYPYQEKPINYYEDVPEFKSYGGLVMVNDNTKAYEPDRFESISDFKQSLTWGREIEFEWKGIRYAAFREGEDDNTFFLCEAYKEKEGSYFKSVDALLDYVIDGQKLRDIITEVDVVFRFL